MYNIIGNVYVSFNAEFGCVQWLLEFKLCFMDTPLFQRGNMRRALWATQEMNSIGKVFHTIHIFM